MFKKSTEAFFCVMKPLLERYKGKFLNKMYKNAFKTLVFSENDTNLPPVPVIIVLEKKYLVILNNQVVFSDPCPIKTCFTNLFAFSYYGVEPTIEMKKNLKMVLKTYFV